MTFPAFRRHTTNSKQWSNRIDEHSDTILQGGTETLRLVGLLLSVLLASEGHLVTQGPRLKTIALGEYFALKEIVQGLQKKMNVHMSRVGSSVLFEHGRM